MKSKFRSILQRLALCGALCALYLGMSGCATTGGDDVSERPWNAPKGWEHGLPPQLYEGR